MSVTEHTLEQLRHSPKLPKILRVLNDEQDDERRRRQQFYQDMTLEQKVEFIDGEVILHSPARNRHLDTTKGIAKLVDTFVEIRKLGTVKIEKCLVVFPRNDYEPDIVFFGREKASSLEADTMKFPLPDLIVEVTSASTEKRDRGVKFEDYEDNGVSEFWIVDPEQEIVEQYVLESGKYELKLKSPSGVLQSNLLPGFEVEIAAFFDGEKNLEALRKLMG